MCKPGFNIHVKELLATCITYKNLSQNTWRRNCVDLSINRNLTCVFPTSLSLLYKVLTLPMIWSNLPDVSASTYISPNCQKYCLFHHILHRFQQSDNKKLKDYIYVTRPGVVRDLQQGFGVIRVILIGRLDDGGSFPFQLLNHR